MVFPYAKVLSLLADPAGKYNTRNIAVKNIKVCNQDIDLSSDTMFFYQVPGLDAGVHGAWVTLANFPSNS